MSPEDKLNRYYYLAISVGCLFMVIRVLSGEELDKSAVVALGLGVVAGVGAIVGWITGVD